jgi:hypothetical protein
MMFEITGDRRALDLAVRTADKCVIHLSNAACRVHHLAQHPRHPQQPHDRPYHVDGQT